MRQHQLHFNTRHFTTALRYAGLFALLTILAATVAHRAGILSPVAAIYIASGTPMAIATAFTITGISFWMAKLHLQITTKPLDPIVALTPISATFVPAIAIVALLVTTFTAPEPVAKLLPMSTLHPILKISFSTATGIMSTALNLATFGARYIRVYASTPTPTESTEHDTRAK